MFSLTYTAAFDPYHTVFRMLCTLHKSEDHILCYRKLRVVDFYMCFPWLIEKIRPARNIPDFVKKKNNIVKNYKQNTYDVIPSSKTIFQNMAPIQMAAKSSLAGKGLVKVDQTDSVILVRDNLDTRLYDRISAYTETHESLLDFLAIELVKLKFEGEDGLKDRTGLEEFRYDDV